MNICICYSSVFTSRNDKRHGVDGVMIYTRFDKLLCKEMKMTRTCQWIFGKKWISDAYTTTPLVSHQRQGMNKLFWRCFYVINQLRCYLSQLSCKILLVLEVSHLLSDYDVVIGSFILLYVLYFIVFHSL